MNTRRAMFVVQIGWLMFLGTLAVAYLTKRLTLPETVGSLPIGIVWFGALGAVLISLTGIVEHADDWKDSYVLWHLSRPFMGASLAVVAVLIMQAGILAVGAAPAGAAQTAMPKNILYYLIAFLVGYREETFRELIKRLVDLVFTPAGAPAPKPLPAANPNQPVVVGGAADAKILVKAKEGQGAEQPPKPADAPPAKPAVEAPPAKG